MVKKKLPKNVWHNVCSIGGGRFYKGETSSGAFINPLSNDLLVRTGSPLIGAANGSYASLADFNGITRGSPFDVGAYETNGQTSNPGSTIGPGFKLATAQTVPPEVPSNLQVD